MKNNVRVLLIAAIFLVTACCGGSGSNNAGETTLSATETTFQELHREATEKAPEEIYARVDYLALWVYDHTWHHPTADELDKPAEGIAREILNYHNGISPTKPILRCASRANMLKIILQMDGTLAHLVALFGDLAPDDSLQGHTLPEFWDPYQAIWVIADPDMLIYWTLNGMRVGVYTAIQLNNYEELVPCNPAGGCGYTISNSENVTPQVFVDANLFLAGLIFSSIPEDYTYKTLLVNRAKENPTKAGECDKIIAAYDWVEVIVFN